MADMTIHEMLDDVDLAIEAAHVTAATFAVAGYVNGRYANWPAIVAKWGRSGMFLLSIDVQAYPPAGAQCLDIEKGDATIGQAPAWFKATQAEGKRGRDLRWFPKLYVSAGSAASLIATMTAAGIARNEYMLWSAHYGQGAHICGPGTCKYPQADATQYTSTFEGASLDASLCYGYFFSGPPAVEPPKPVAPPKPSVTWAQWPSGLILKDGSQGNAVKVLQAALRDSGIEGVRGIGVDGSFGPQTLAAVRNFQGVKGLQVDGVAGAKTRAALVALGDVEGVVAANAAEAAKVVEVPKPAVEEPVKAPESPQEPTKPVVSPEPVPAPEPAPVPAPEVPEPAPSVEAPEVPEKPESLVYVQEIVSPEFAEKIGLPAGTILFIPHMIQGA